MSLKRMYAIIVRQTYLYRDNPSRFFQMFSWMLIDLVLWGFLSEYLFDIGNTSFSIALALLGAVLLWGFLNRVHQGVMMAFLEDSWSRNFLNIFATPLKLSEYVGGFVVSTIVTSVVVFVVVAFLAFLFFGFSIFILGVSLVPFLLILFLFGVSLGILAAAIVLRLGPSAEWFTWPIAAVLGPVVGVFYPVSTLPSWMQAIAYLLPPTYVFEGMRSVLIGGTFGFQDVVVGMSLVVVYALGAYGVFAWVYRTVIRNGQIARYTAESL
ncbi:ABC transporter permease [Candidatus Kaiserbacteria bacterium]|nr:ABC transporter permease [Candidatus Kaiserbacteria bacterium]